MKFNRLILALLIAVVFFILAGSCYYYSTLGAVEIATPAEGSTKMENLSPVAPASCFIETKADFSLTKKLVTYPDNPSPGDFLIIEGGPFDNPDNLRLTFDFPGALSQQYPVGNLIYIIVGISCDTEPGLYQLAFKKGSGEDPAGRETVLAADMEIVPKKFAFSRFSMPADRTAGWTAAHLEEDREKVRQARERTELHPLWTDPFISPLAGAGRISSQYGAVRVINNNPPRRHVGIDIAADEGTPVVSTNRGIVRLAEFLLSGGNTVIVDHGMGLSSSYLHLDEIAVESGQWLECGDIVGTVGMTGYATGPHLHWEVNIGQDAVNPEQLMDGDLLWVPPAYVSKMVFEREN
ncbi:MAG: M23 family metallopeptidase [Bacillota bacterium]|nr:M23 family metallopeptidase [Bacillota bacterium]